MGAEVIVEKEVLGLARDAMNCMKEYAVCKQEEITERKRIKAQLTALSRAIDAKKEMYMSTMERRSEERKEMYNIARETMTIAAQNGDVDMVNSMTHFMLETYKNAQEINFLGTKMLEEKSI